MDFALTQEQTDLKATARRYLSERYPAGQVAALADGPGGSQADAWPQLLRQGWLDADLGVVELALLAEESGYALHPAPWWTTVALAAPLLPEQERNLTGPATFADGCREATSGRVRADRNEAGWRLHGRVQLVADAGPARTMVVRAMTDTGPALFTIDAHAPGVIITELSSVDSLRRMARVGFVWTPARLLFSPEQAGPVLAAARLRAAALLACEAVGVAARALDMAVAYACQREQFGRPIGGFQAVAHQLAEAYVETELSRSLAYRAAWLVGSGSDSDEMGQAVAHAVIAARQAAVRCCEIAIQTTGGMGVTWEYPLHRWFRRALWLQAFPVLDPEPHEQLAASLLDPVESGLQPPRRAQDQPVAAGRR